MDPKTKNDFGIRIKERREALGISQAELARRVGYTSRSMITKIEKCESDVARDKLLALADILHTSPLYLLGLTDDPTPASALPQNAFPLTPYGKLPIYGGIAAGNPVDMEQGEFEWGYEDKEYCDGRHFMLRVEGDSMEPTVPNGATAIILVQDYADKGQIVAFEFDGVATLKRYFPQTNGTVLLRADNPAAESYVITQEQLQNGQARILGVLREYKKKF